MEVYRITKIVSDFHTYISLIFCTRCVPFQKKYYYYYYYCSYYLFFRCLPDVIATSNNNLTKWLLLEYLSQYWQLREAAAAAADEVESCRITRLDETTKQQKKKSQALGNGLAAFKNGSWETAVIMMLLAWRPRLSFPRKLGVFISHLLFEYIYYADG